MKILHVVGARPNFMKAAPVIAAMKKAGGFRQVLVHTGQHYDKAMSDVFFRDLGMPKPDVNLGVGSHGRKMRHAFSGKRHDGLQVAVKHTLHHESGHVGRDVCGRKKSSDASAREMQIAEIERRFEPVLKQQKPDWVFVYGDVNSTVACARVAKRLGVKIAHVEAGLRSFDKTMPEELNRVITDHIADLLFVTEKSGLENLKREGIDRRKVHFVGNTMIDTLVRLLPKARKRFIATDEKTTTVVFKRCPGEGRSPSQCLRQRRSDFVLVTLHRPSNVDNPVMLKKIMKELMAVSKHVPVLFPVHPRTAKLLGRAEGVRLRSEAVADLRFAARGQRSEISPQSSVHSLQSSGLHLLPPLGYLDFLALQMNAAMVITDSGGIQEETSYLGVPCLTVRRNTERPVTITDGTNHLCRIGEIYRMVNRVMCKVHGRRSGEVFSHGHKPTTCRLETALEATRRRFKSVAKESGRISSLLVRPARRIPLWDGHAAGRIVDIVKRVKKLTTDKRKLFDAS